jgi:hypothetical protein
MMDYGYRNPTCILYVAIDSEGIVHIYDEYYQAEKLIKVINTGRRLTS